MKMNALRYGHIVFIMYDILCIAMFFRYCSVNLFEEEISVHFSTVFIPTAIILFLFFLFINNPGGLLQ